MKKKHKVCFVFAVIFTVLTLFFASLCVSSQLGAADFEHENDGVAYDGGGAVGNLFGVLVMGLAIMIAWIHLLFWSFGGVVTSAVNFNCPNARIRLLSRIMLCFDGVCFVGSISLFLYSIMII